MTADVLVEVRGPLAILWQGKQTDVPEWRVEASRIVPAALRVPDPDRMLSRHLNPLLHDPYVEDASSLPGEHGDLPTPDEENRIRSMLAAFLSAHRGELIAAISSHPNPYSEAERLGLPNRYHTKHFPAGLAKMRLLWRSGNGNGAGFPGCIEISAPSLKWIEQKTADIDPNTAEAAEALARTIDFRGITPELPDDRPARLSSVVWRNKKIRLTPDSVTAHEIAVGTRHLQYVGVPLPFGGGPT